MSEYLYIRTILLGRLFGSQIIELRSIKNLRSCLLVDLSLAGVDEKPLGGYQSFLCERILDVHDFRLFFQFLIPPILEVAVLRTTRTAGGNHTNLTEAV